MKLIELVRKICKVTIKTLTKNKHSFNFKHSINFKQLNQKSSTPNNSIKSHQLQSKVINSKQLNQKSSTSIKSHQLQTLNQLQTTNATSTPKSPIFKKTHVVIVQQSINSLTAFTLVWPLLVHQLSALHRVVIVEHRFIHLPSNRERIRGLKLH